MSNRTNNRRIPILALIASVAFLGCASAGRASELQLTCDMRHGHVWGRSPPWTASIASVEVSLSSNFNSITLTDEISAKVFHVMRNGDREQVPPGRYQIFRMDDGIWSLMDANFHGLRYNVQVMPTPLGWVLNESNWIENTMVWGLTVNAGGCTPVA